MIEEANLPYFLIVQRRTDRLMSFPREVETTLSRIWTHIADSISYEDYHYTKSASTLYYK